MSVLCGILDYFSSRDRGKTFEFLFFLPCLFSLGTWHHIRFNFTNGLERQASLICCAGWARKTWGPSGHLPCWWGIRCASPSGLAGALPPWGALLRMGAPMAFCRWDAALIGALQGMAGDQAAAPAARSAAFCLPHAALPLLGFLLKCPQHGWRN